MPELIEQMYCSQQIVIPPKFPYILKRFCKAAIKTQPYDLLRWSYEYFTALAERRPPPVKLRLEYPVFSTEGGLTRGCLKVLANQLIGMTSVPLTKIKTAWKGFCLDSQELKRILCLCEVYLRHDMVPFLHFIAVAGGLLTKSLTHTMILLCETLTKEADGGSSAIPAEDFLFMYRLLARMDASKNCKYIDGLREGVALPEEIVEEETLKTESYHAEEESIDEFWQDNEDLQRLVVINDSVPRTSRLSEKLNMPVIGHIERSPSVERAGQIERENYMRERKGAAHPSAEIEEKMRDLSSTRVAKEDVKPKPEKAEKSVRDVEIIVTDEDDNELPYEIFGEPKIVEAEVEDEEKRDEEPEADNEEEKPAESEAAFDVQQFVNNLYKDREERREDLEKTFMEIAHIVDRFKSANYDLGTVAGRQMSTTSGEFIVHHVEKDIMDYINQQIEVLPDPDLKKKKAKPEEVAMVRDILVNFLDENMDVIIPELEEAEEEEQPIPDIVMVYAVPGIGPPVDEDICVEFENYILEVSKVQGEIVMPRNIRHFLCPPMEKCEEYQYDEGKKEEVPMAGVITD
ncbi:uncharacterized protein LOC126964469 [Leptidea sinapis]|uniref:uncharacterized protein LOC126964469 n=1 Tax=Leptidea sinapis TaxID=189913 RepID=UPI002132AF70|nr:uncharacterized protein LOC126964469 [Leptidea sinapis]